MRGNSAYKIVGKFEIYHFEFSCSGFPCSQDKRAGISVYPIFIHTYLPATDFRTSNDDKNTNSNEIITTIPALIVGCGVIAKYHVKAMQTSGKFRCVAVVDPNIVAAEEITDEILKEMLHRKRPKIFSSIDEALEATDVEFKVAFILGPDHVQVNCS